MKQVLKAFLISGFLMTAVFGIFAVACQGLECGHDVHRWCFATQAQSAPCPEKGNTLAFINFHLDALKTFSEAVFANGSFGYLLALLSIISAIGLGVMSVSTFQLASFLQPRPRFLSEFYDSVPEYRLLRWLALHENSPAIL